ncbi:D-alanyl-D-alanine carboxypeptidase/D-alanyl-D-alanine-endopeptidase [Micromonospora sp. BL1]|nr:D-alanyl-D-alanine carboxypeptidase/D-alanyl-D-alanine-endopeptidase [Micromonospora sp. BL1]
MGREDSHYRPERVDGRGSAGSGSGGATGRVSVPGANVPHRPSPATGSARVGPPHPGSGVPHHGSGPASGSARVGPPHDPAAPLNWPGAPAPIPVSPPVPPVGAAPPVPSGPPPARPRRRLRLVAALACVLVLALAVAGLAVLRPGPVAGWLGDDDSTGTAVAAPPEPSPQVVLAGPDGNAPLPTEAGIRSALDPLVRAAALGDRVHVSVADVSTGQTLYGSGQDTPTVPASVTKLATGVAVLAARGPAYRIPTRAVAGANPGEVVLVGGGDPTLAVDKNGFYPGAARLDDLAAQVRDALGGTAPTKVIVDSSLFSGPVFEPGWDADIPTGGFGAAITALMTDGARKNPAEARRTAEQTNHAAERVPQPDLTAGRQFAKLLGLTGGAAQVARGTAPAASGATGTAAGAELGTVESLPMIRLVDIMISDSDNVIAEAMARQVALAKGKPGSFVGGAAATDQVLGELGLPAGEISLADGSGLSRTNRISPSLLTDLITLAGNGSHPELAAIFGGLPVGGWSGTLDERYRAAATRAGAGVVRAKTGTLSGVNAIAGTVTTADGRLLTFAVLTDRTQGSLDETRAALDRISSALAGCGCR